MATIFNCGSFHHRNPACPGCWEFNGRSDQRRVGDDGATVCSRGSGDLCLNPSHSFAGTLLKASRLVLSLAPCSSLLNRGLSNPVPMHGSNFCDGGHADAYVRSTRAPLGFPSLPYIHHVLLPCIDMCVGYDIGK